MDTRWRLALGVENGCRGQGCELGGERCKTLDNKKKSPELTPFWQSFHCHLLSPKISLNRLCSFAQRLVDYICVGLYVGTSFCLLDLFVYSFTETMRLDYFLRISMDRDYVCDICVFYYILSVLYTLHKQ